MCLLNILDKAQDRHVQNTKYHPLLNVADHICVSAVVLPSRRKDHVYNISILSINLPMLLRLAFMSQQPFIV